MELINWLSYSERCFVVKCLQVTGMYIYINY